MPEDRVRCLEAGADDYIAKPINDVILLAKVRVFLDLYRGRQELQRLVAELDARNRQLEVEIAERKRAEQEVRHRATHDTLTELPNRALFMDRVEQALQRADRQRSQLALLYLDIDGFKPVNDTLGHHAGDLLLQQIAQRLGSAVRKSDTVARLGGDEFAVVVQDTAESPDSAEQLARAVAHASLLRILRFHTQNDHRDWNIVHHGFTTAHAIRHEPILGGEGCVVALSGAPPREARRH